MSLDSFHLPPAPQVIRLRLGDKVSKHETGRLAPGKAIFEVENATDERGTFVAALVPSGIISFKDSGNQKCPPVSLARNLSCHSAPVIASSDMTH